jgi:hypothetical protein
VAQGEKRETKCYRVVLFTGYTETEGVLCLDLESGVNKN